MFACQQVVISDNLQGKMPEAGNINKFNNVKVWALLQQNKH